MIFLSQSVDVGLCIGVDVGVGDVGVVLLQCCWFWMLIFVIGIGFDVFCWCACWH